MLILSKITPDFDNALPYKQKIVKTLVLRVLCFTHFCEAKLVIYCILMCYKTNFF
jgi:hypothetical protein